MKFDYSTIEDKFLTLPDEVKFAMTSPGVAQTIQEISSKFGLLLDQMDTLFDVTSYVMLGLIPQQQFSSTLARELNIGEKQARMITAEISDKVFSSIRESMRSYETQATPSSKIINETYKANSGQFGKIEKEDMSDKSESKIESPHADLENAGDFKIETTVPTELEMMQERREYIKKQKALEAQQKTPAPNASETATIATQAEPISTKPSQNPAPTIDEPISNFDAHSYYDFNVTNEEDGGAQTNEEETKTSKNEQSESTDQNTDEDKMTKEKEITQENNVDNDTADQDEENSDEENTEPSFDLDEAIKEHKMEEKTESEVKPSKQEEIVPVNLPTEEIVKDAEESPKPIDVELNKLISQIPTEEPKKDANIKVAEETIKAIENNPTTESINLLDKQNIKTNEEHKTEIQPVTAETKASQEELRNDIRSQIANNNPAIDISDTNNFKQAEKMLEDKAEEVPVKPHFINNQDFAKQNPSVPSPISRPSTSNKSDPYREPVE